MAKITINRENFKVDEVQLEQGTLSIGRSKDNLVHLDDPTVSSHHAQIVTVFNSSYVEDLGSTNGTYINGQKSKTHTLHNGDILTIGHYQILFQGEDQDKLKDLNATMMIGVSQLEALTKKAKQPRTAAGKQKPQPQAVAAASTTADSASGVAPTPELQVHQNEQQPIVREQTLPDIDDNTELLDFSQTHRPEPQMRKLRKSDTSPIPSIRVIVLGALAAIATFTLLILLFR
jgi:pSer/pThr/pTyr-binding forkhead associated (FHA) protein